MTLLTMKIIVKVTDPLGCARWRGRRSVQRLGPRGNPLQSREKPLLAVRLSLVFVLIRAIVAERRDWLWEEER
ncbi:hypothetical protein [Paenibacillus eucommiae]|uniref:Uncharacterized protein n=1 Tax=Paenibacillus eucommiae TaxID=1355755 RepID=A0ABS4J7F3_9BACL|nr:hypothetical protein [Paenibacillus eucommiae]MBP1995743.1 hypothetical protein [Paenibacillus eucommiae]